MYAVVITYDVVIIVVVIVVVVVVLLFLTFSVLGILVVNSTKYFNLHGGGDQADSYGNKKLIRKWTKSVCLFVFPILWER